MFVIVGVLEIKLFPLLQTRHVSTWLMRSAALKARKRSEIESKRNKIEDLNPHRGPVLWNNSPASAFCSCILMHSIQILELRVVSAEHIKWFTVSLQSKQGLKCTLWVSITVMAVIESTPEGHMLWPGLPSPKQTETIADRSPERFLPGVPRPPSLSQRWPREAELMEGQIYPTCGQTFTPRSGQVKSTWSMKTYCC